MNMVNSRTSLAIAGAILCSGCATGNQFVLLGESTVPGTQAVAEANIRIGNANASGCKAISVGGYGLGDEATLIGIPVLVDCPAGTNLLPDGTLSP